MEPAELRDLIADFLRKDERFADLTVHVGGRQDESLIVLNGGKDESIYGEVTIRLDDPSEW